ncbi:MAG: efflux RND transporter periplasmic adaptor subunit [bacterium]
MRILKSNKAIAIVSFAFLALLFFSLKDKFTNNNFVEINNKPKQIISVQYLIAKSSKLNNSIKINGTILSNEEVELRSQISGKIVNIGFTEGGRVNKGQLLIKINDLELKAQKAKIETKLLLAKDREFRQKKLLEKELSSQQEYDIILNDLNAQTSDLELINAQIEKTEIIAPFDGIIGLRNISIGSYVTPETKIATVQNYDIIKIDFSVPQKYSQFVEKNKKVKFVLPNIQNLFLATIYAIEPKIDQNSRTLQVRASSAYNAKLIIGAYVEVELPIGDNNNTIFIPSHVIVPDITGQLIYVYKNGIAKQVNVQTGIRTEKEVEIIDGISVGDTIITTGLLLMKDGIKVKLQ